MPIDEHRQARIEWIQWADAMSERGVKAQYKGHAVNEPIQDPNLIVFKRGQKLAVGDLVAHCEETVSSPPLYKIARRYQRSGNPVFWNELVPA